MYANNASNNACFCWEDDDDDDDEDMSQANLGYIQCYNAYQQPSRCVLAML